MKISSYAIILTLVLVNSLGTSGVSAQTNAPIMVTTNQPTYSDGDQMVISGTVSAQLNVPISIVVRDPSGNIVLIGQVSVNPNNSYSTTVTAGGDLWTAVGTYEVDVTYGSKANTARTTFQFVGSILTTPIIIEGQVYNATYTIVNGKVLGIIPDTSSKSLTIRIQPVSNGTISITLPRSLIDAKNNGQDIHYVVTEDGVSTTFNETRTDSVERTLVIPVGSGTTQITIIGTQIVPEFSVFAILVLAIAMMSAIFYFRFKTYVKIF